jgi:hypothetical protein
LDSTELACDASGKLSATTFDAPYSLATGPVSNAGTMYKPSRRPGESIGMLTSSLVDSLAPKPVQRRLFTIAEAGLPGKTADSGTKCCELCESFDLVSLLLKTWAAHRPGKMRSRMAWRVLATLFPASQFHCRLTCLVRLILAGDCSGLPTLTGRDWRSPGKPNHSRLNASRGEPLTETIGSRLSPEFAEWMMGFPVGWTDASESKPVETLFVQSSPSGLENELLRQPND